MYYKQAIILIFVVITGHGLAAQEVNDLLDQAWEILETNPSQSLSLLDQAIIISVQKGDVSAELEALEMKGIVYDELDFSNKALEIYLEVLKRKEALDNKGEIISPLMNMGIVYQKIHEYELAEETLIRARNLAKETQDTSWLVSVNANLGINFSRTGEYQKAIQVFKESISLCGSDSVSLYNLKTNLALAYQRSKEIDSAISLNKEAHSFYKGKSKIAESSVLANLAECYTELKQTEKAKSYAESALAIAKEVGYTDLETNICKNLMEISEIEKDYGQALNWSKTQIKTKEILDSTRNSRYINTLNTVYEVDKKNAEIADLESDKLAKSKRIWQLAVACIGFILLVVFITLRNRLKSQKFENQRKLEAQETEQKSRELSIYKKQLEEKTSDLLERNKRIQKLETELVQKKEEQLPGEEIQELLTNKILTQKDWEGYKRTFSMVYPGFFERLENLTSDLTAGEQRTAALMRLELSNLETGEILGISERSVIQNKYRLRKKIGSETNEELLKVLQGL